MNLNAPHTILVVNHPRVRLSLPRLSRVLGPGVYHYEGDLRRNFKTLNQVKLVERRAIEVFFEAGDTSAFVRRQIDGLNATIQGLYADGKTPEESELGALNARLTFFHTIAARDGVDVKTPLQSTLEPADADEITIADDSEPEPVPETVVKPRSELSAEQIQHVAKQLLGMPAEARNTMMRELKADYSEESYQGVVRQLDLYTRAAQPTEATAPVEEDHHPQPEERSQGETPVALEEKAAPADESAEVGESESGTAAAGDEAAVLAEVPEDDELEPTPVTTDDEGVVGEESDDEPEALATEEATAVKEDSVEEVVTPTIDPELAAQPASTLNGIGAKTQSKLEAVDLGTLGAIAQSTPEALAQIDTISEDEAVAHIAEARSRLGLTE